MSNNKQKTEVRRKSLTEVKKTSIANVRRASQPDTMTTKKRSPHTSLTDIRRGSQPDYRKTSIPSLLPTIKDGVNGDSDDSDVPEIDHTGPIHHTRRDVTFNRLSVPSYESLIRKESIHNFNKDLFKFLKIDSTTEGFSSDGSDSPVFKESVKP